MVSFGLSLVVTRCNPLVGRMIVRAEHRVRFHHRQQRARDRRLASIHEGLKSMMPGAVRCREVHRCAPVLVGPHRMRAQPPQHRAGRRRAASIAPRVDLRDDLGTLARFSHQPFGLAQLLRGQAGKQAAESVGSKRGMAGPMGLGTLGISHWRTRTQCEQIRFSDTALSDEKNS